RSYRGDADHHEIRVPARHGFGGTARRIGPQLGLHCLGYSEPRQNGVELNTALPAVRIATVGAARKAARSVSVVLTSVGEAPLRTATPRPVRPRSTREPATSLCRAMRSSAMSGGRMATSNGSPASIRRLRSGEKAYSTMSLRPVMHSKTGLISFKTLRGAALLRPFSSAAVRQRLVTAPTRLASLRLLRRS